MVKYWQSILPLHINVLTIYTSHVFCIQFIAGYKSSMKLSFRAFGSGTSLGTFYFQYDRCELAIPLGDHCCTSEDIKLLVQ